MIAKEDVMIVLLTLITIELFYVGRKLSFLEGEFSHFKRSFESLARDFKEHLKNHA